MEFELNLEIVRTQLKRKNVPFNVEEVLGSGSFGTVVKAQATTSKEPVAIKFVHASKMHEYMCSEVRNHRILRHPHVIRFHRAMEVGGHLAIVMEYANGSSLFRVVKKHKKLSEPLARWIFQQLILAVEYCHRKGVASRDIKCENVLLVKGHQLPIVKLSDFGYSHSTHTAVGCAKSIVGSVDYMAPEVVTNYDAQAYDAMKADVWSCGVVLYVMLAGHYPFTRKHVARGNLSERERTRRKIAALDYKFPEHVSGEVCSLLKKILTYSEDRISVQEIMENPWFLKHFPQEAHNMNTELLAEEAKGSTRAHDAQTDEDVEYEIMKASLFDREKRPGGYVPDSVIDAEIEEDLRRFSKNC